MSFLSELRARSKKGPGSVNVYFGGDDKPIVVPLKYPKAAAQAEVMAFVNEIDNDNASPSETMEANEKLTNLMVRLCIDTDEDLSEDEITILVRESGGHVGALARRCSQLMGFGATAAESDQGSTSKGGKRRGR